MKMERMTMSLEVKRIDFADPEFFSFDGYLSTFRNEDSGGDIVQPGAFTKTIQEWKALGRNLPALWQHRTHEPIGVFSEMQEDAKGLYVSCKMPKTDTLVSGRIIPQMKIGSVRTMSIGYSARKFDYVNEGKTRNLWEIHLWEGSLVTSPMNDQAIVTNFKSMSEFKSLPCAPTTQEWDQENATRRVDAAGVSKAAHLWFSDDCQKFLIADIIDDKLTLIPKALALAAYHIQIGDSDIPVEAIPALKEQIGRYYREIGKESPFQERDCIRLDYIEQLSPRDLEALFRKGVSFSQSEAKRIVKLLVPTRRDVEDRAHRDGDKELSNILEEIRKFNSLIS